VTTEEFLRRASDAAMAKSTEATWDDMVAIGRIACGSPETVANTIVDWCEEAGAGRVNLVLESGDMPEWKVAKNTSLFADEVIPRIRARTGAGAGKEPELAAAGVK
jgi:alkanesulfonate monooxygenase SsuD/methylene tetrahydromethanopterin reductase-like flavin-dependent oxidoreductase (luciferase family)